MYPIITVFGRDIGVYSLCVLIGLLVSAAVFGTRAKKIGLYAEDVVLLVVIIGAGMGIGGSLLYGLTNWRVLFRLFASLSKLSFGQILTVLKACFGGSVYYGGLIGASLGVRWYSRRKAPEIRSYLIDLYAICIPLFHAFGRVGCFFGGCCYGIESRFGCLITDNPLVPDLNGVRRFPVALTEASIELLLFIMLYYLQKKGKLAGKLFYLYGLTYSAVRFCLEYLRGDAVRGIWYGLSTSQWIRIMLILVCGGYFVRDLFLRKNKRT